MSSPSPEPGAAVESGTGSADGSCPCLVALGERLRRARDERGLEPSVLADRLRLGVEQLQALESADRQRLPEPVFVIAQARRVADALKIDVTAELQALRASGELVLSARPGSLRRAPSGPDSARPLKADVAARRGAWRSSARRGRSASVRLAQGALGGLLLALAGLGGLARLRPSGMAGLHPRARQGDAGAARAPQGPSPARSPARSAASPGTLAAGQLLLSSREPSWVEVRRPDGVVVFRGLLRGSRLFPLGQGLEVMAARPDLVSSRVGSGPARTLGAISEVRWRSLPPRP